MNSRYVLELAVIVILVGFIVALRTARALVDDSHITITSSADITTKRQALIHFIWGEAGFPSGKLPSEVQDNVTSPIPNLNNLERVTNLKIEMDGELEGLAHHFIPSNKNNRLVVVHLGHYCTFYDGPGSGQTDRGIQKTINRLLSEGFSVLAVYMPHLRPDDCTSQHDQMFRMATTGSPMKFFLEPVAVSLNYLERHEHYQEFSMVGLSGGGWTTTIYAAIDPRITASFPVAGTIPLYLRYESYPHDKEQYLPGFYKIAGYPDLYALGSYGPGRKRIQILIRNDDCCFSENQYNETQAGMSFETAVRDYETKVRTVLETLDSGSFRVYFDETAPIHMISDHVIENVILPELNDEVYLTSID
jgi:pimeloyl-ACP methyl ester carboxylesterase